MLLIWPLVARQFDVRMDPARALIWTLLAGYLILPPVLAINLPLAYVLSAIGTALTNREPMVFAQTFIPAMKLYDSASAVATRLIALLPFMLARR